MEAIHILNEQLHVLTQLSQLLERENELLTSKERNPQAMEPIIEEKIEIGQRLTAIENRRHEIMGEITLKQWAEEGGQGIEEVVSQYESKMNHISNLVEINKILIGIGVKYYEDVLNTISESTKEKANTYGQAGQMNQSEIQKTSLLSRKA